MPSCCIVQCGARKDATHPQLTFHRIPKKEILRKKWLDIIGIQNLNPRHKDWHICSLHFDESSFNRTLDVIRLRENAVPSTLLVVNNKSRKCPRKNRKINSSACKKVTNKQRKSVKSQRLNKQHAQSLTVGTLQDEQVAIQEESNDVSALCDEDTILLIVSEQSKSDSNNTSRNEKHTNEQEEIVLFEGPKIQPALSITVGPLLRDGKAVTQEVNNGASRSCEQKPSSRIVLKPSKFDHSYSSTCEPVTNKQVNTSLHEKHNIQRKKNPAVDPILHNEKVTNQKAVDHASGNSGQESTSHIALKQLKYDHSYSSASKQVRNGQHAQRSTSGLQIENMQLRLQEVRNKETIKRITLTCKNQRRKIKCLTEQVRRNRKKINRLENIIQDLEKRVQINNNKI